MKIKKYPEERETIVNNIEQGECFCLLEDLYAGDTPSDCEWDKGEVFMKCDETFSGVIKVVHIETGVIDEFKSSVKVEKVKAHIVCE